MILAVLLDKDEFYNTGYDESNGLVAGAIHIDIRVNEYDEPVENGPYVSSHKQRATSGFRLDRYNDSDMEIFDLSLFSGFICQPIDNRNRYNLNNEKAVEAINVITYSFNEGLKPL